MKVFNMINSFNYNNNSFDGYTYDGPSNPISGFEREEIPNPEAIDSVVLDDLKHIIVKHSDLPEKNKWMRVSQTWNGFVETENQWNKVAKRLHIPSVSEEEQVKEQIKDFIRISNDQCKKHMRGYGFFAETFTRFMQEELDVLVKSQRMQDINTLRQVCEAKDTLTVWQDLQERIPNLKGHLNLDMNQFHSVKELIEMAGKLKKWCKDNEVELSKLQNLDLTGKHLISLPTKIWKFLPNLTVLNLSQNHLVTLPNEMWKFLPNLTDLNLSDNQLTSLPTEIGNLNLSTLNLRFNFFTSMSDEIFQLVNLQHLDMSFNCLTSLPEKISQLQNLRNLCLRNNWVTSLPIEILQMVNLQQLDLRSNALWISVPDGFWQSPLAPISDGLRLMSNLNATVSKGVLVNFSFWMAPFILNKYFLRGLDIPCEMARLIEPNNLWCGPYWEHGLMPHEIQWTLNSNNTWTWALPNSTG
jgi:hypothetical protein